MRITPLNLVTALLLAWVGYSLLFEHMAVSIWLILGWVIVMLIADQFFRLRLKNLRRIWIAEILFIIFAAVLVLLFKRA